MRGLALTHNRAYFYIFSIEIKGCPILAKKQIIEINKKEFSNKTKLLFHPESMEKNCASFSPRHFI